MIREQNYNKVAQYTKKAFQTFAKRALAAKLLSVLGRSKPKKQFILDNESQNAQEEDSYSNDLMVDRKGEDAEGKTTNFKFTRQILNQVKQNNNCTQIDKVRYGDYVSLQIGKGSENCRMVVIMGGIRFFTLKQMPMNCVNARKMCFQICSPSPLFGEQGQDITNQSMVCLRSVFASAYLTLTETILSAQQLGYEVVLKPQISKDCIFKMNNNREGQISTDFEISLSFYYSPQLFLSVEQAELQNAKDRILIATYSEKWFRISHLNSLDLSRYPYYYVVCSDINQRVRGQHVPFSSQVHRREYNRLQLQCENNEKQVLTYQDPCCYYELGQMNQGRQVQIKSAYPDSLYQIWEVQTLQKVQKVTHCFMYNLITGQTLLPEQQGQMALKDKVIKLKNNSPGQYSFLHGEEGRLWAVYDSDRQRYELKVQHESSMKKTGVSRNYVGDFQLVQVQAERCEAIVEIMECFEVLKGNYPFLEKWGFDYELHQQKLTYSLTLMKGKMIIIKRKIMQVSAVIDKLSHLLTKDSDVSGLKDMIRQSKALQMLILYCKIINSKIDNRKYHSKEMYKIAHRQLKQLQQRLFSILYTLVYNSKGNSEVIIEHSIFFNHLLALYPQTIGVLLQQSIKNLCLLTNKISKEELVLFEWTRLVQYITAPQKIDVQRKYIDIISEVAIDPNDIGITPYQNKIKEQLFNRSKKKIFPKYILDGQLGPLICFQYSDFPIDCAQIVPAAKCFQLISLFKNRICIFDYVSHVDYICSLLKLMRNLCKDRNRKMPKVVQDYGLTQDYMHNVFKCPQIGWKLIAHFLDLYCSLYLIQDPFVSFTKRQVKCFALTKIENIDLNKKTAILFRQFTQEHIAQQKLKQFDTCILPLLQMYFEQLSIADEQGDEFQLMKSIQMSKESSNSFIVFVNVVYEIVNYGYLSHQQCSKYIRIILKHTEITVKMVDSEEKRRRILQQVVKLCRMGQEINTIIHGINLLKRICTSLHQSTQSSSQDIINIFSKALYADERSLKDEKQLFKLRSLSSGEKLFRTNEQRSIQQPFRYHNPDFQQELIRFILLRLIDSSSPVNKACLVQLIALLEMISLRGNRICDFLTDVLIFNAPDEENLYLEYSGVTPIGYVGDTSSSSRRLLNVMKVKQLVDRITQDSIEQSDQERKKEKIYELNNLLSKVLTNMETLKNKNYRLFGICQLLLQKLKMHSILALVLPFYEYENYQELIGEIVHFYINFVQGNPENLTVMAQFFPELTKRYAYRRLPHLLGLLFEYVQNQEEAFELLFNNISKKMQHSHREILFACIYRILKLCSQQLFDKIKGKAIYALTSIQNFSSYIRGQTVSLNFINLLCFLGRNSASVQQKIKQLIRKAQLLRGLQSQQSSYELKWIYLRLYQFLYFQFETKLDQVQMTLILEQIFLKELKHLPSCCRVRALKTIDKIEPKQGQKRSVEQQAIQKEFQSLMMQTKMALSASQEENYFNFLLNIQDEEQFSMLVCLEFFIRKFKVLAIDGLSSYIFKLISFMDRIFTHENTYQSRILNKLYQICETLSEKYNRSDGFAQRLPYSQAYPLVQHFYRRLAGIIQKENISYSQLLSCAEITNDELIKARTGLGIRKMVPQSQLSNLVNRLSSLANSRGQFEGLSDTNVKECFAQLREKNGYLMDIFSFMNKLVALLQFQKEDKVIQKINQNQSSDNSLLWEDSSISIVNRELIKNQILSYKNIFHMILKNSLTQKIQSQMCEIMQNRQEKTRNTYQLHQVGQVFGVTPVFIGIIMQMQVKKGSKPPTVKSFDKYCCFLLQISQRNMNPNLMKVIKYTYLQIKENKVLEQRFGQLIVSLGELLQEMIKHTENQTMHSVFEIFKSLTYEMCQDSTLSQNKQQKLSFSMTALLIKCFDEISRGNSTSYCLYCCQKLLGIIANSFEQMQIIAKNLAQNYKFTSQFVQYIKKILTKTTLSTNFKYSQHLTLIRKVCFLVKKLRSKGFKEEVSLFLKEWPFEYIYEVVEAHYKAIAAEKGYTKQRCKGLQSCSKEFCNEGYLTDYDQEVINRLVNLLTVIRIAADLKQEGYLLTESSLLERCVKYQRGCIQAAEKKGGCLLEMVHRIDIRIDNKPLCLYFSVPILNQSSQNRLEKQINQEIQVITKERFFGNLNKLSSLVQQEIYSQRSQMQNVLGDKYQTFIVWLQHFCILYLLIVCFLFLEIDLRLFTVLNIINCLILIFKLVIFLRDLKRFLRQRTILMSLEYQKYALFWKYSRIASSILIIICYSLLFIKERFYAITLFLELYRLKTFEWIVSYNIQGLKLATYMIIPTQIFLLGCSFKIVDVGYPATVLETYLKIQYEILVMQNNSIDPQDPNSFPILKVLPFMIPITKIMWLATKFLVIAYITNCLLAHKGQKVKDSQACNICLCTRRQFEKPGLSFAHHISREHNPWNYIYFFVYARKYGQNRLLPKALLQKLAKEDYQFLKIRPEGIK